MPKGIRQVRRAIKQRKKKRQQDIPDFKLPTTYPMIQEEGKHGFQPTVDEYVHDMRFKNKSSLSSMFVKIWTCIVLFIGVALLLSNESERLESAQVWLTSQLQEEFPFAKAKVWYETTFGGTPLSIAPQGNRTKSEEAGPLLPVMGQVTETFQANGTGIMISPEEESTVNAVDDGVVIFTGKDKETGRTVTIQHADGTDTTYGNLDQSNVHVYQQVWANEPIGTFSPSEANEVMFFSVEKGSSFIDPAQVIPVDDLP